ncbi:LysR family transcriptional regulator [Vibrio quintilis]|uniref:HTH-type transcriptional regulator DmlR n=1 Tax=Vibrio quintilis TaxID=1117707 RepID=A0A1M7YQB1_9VIBR|nr:LysR family transcriptional regulator [Vibrio quintilis]SHO54706.1 HTH-type transcriptional regulator DmlR [Vibrio quintilis]
MIDQIDPLWLKSFHSVYEHQSFKQAAEQLVLPTSNVSRHVALLEEKLGTRLLERTTRRVSPTGSGEQLYTATKRLFTALHDALEDVSTQSQALSGQLKILVPDIPELANAITSFCVSHPGISLSCETSVSARETLLDGFDVILQYQRGSLTDSGWIAREIFRLNSVVVASPQLIARCGKPFHLHDFTRLPCISSLTALEGCPWIFKHKNQHPIRQHVNTSLKVNSGHIAKSAAIAGLGFAILPQLSCQQEIETGQLEIIPTEAEPEDLVLYAFYAGRKHIAPRVSEFVGYLQRWF